MGFEYKFSKVLKVKENEKDQALAIYFEAVSNFEQVATKLYELLKKKEDLEDFQNERLNKGLPIQEIQYYQQFISNLEKAINHQQTLVINARNQMEYHRGRLVEKNVEVKKYEKIKERDFNRFIEQEKQNENKLMDEISIQQFINRTK